MKIHKVTGEFADISNRLRMARAYYNLSQKKYAEEAGVPPKSYNQWESGAFRISIPGAIKVRERFGLSLDFIYCGSLDALPHKMASAFSSNPLDIASNKSNDNSES